MKARRYTHDDFDAMRSWYKDRDSDAPTMDALPEIGFIVDHYAAGFLFVTEGKHIGMIEGFISSPTADHTDRQKALQLVTEALISEAESLKIRRLMAFTTAQSIYDRALSNGFNYIGNFSLLAKALK